MSAPFLKRGWALGTIIALSASALAHADLRIRPTVGQSFILREVAPERLQELASRVRDAFALETRFDDACEDRAHLIAEFAERQGIHAAKIFIQKNVRPAVNPRSGQSVQWFHHVAAVFLDDRGREFVIDPFFAEPLIPLQTRVERLSSASRPNLSAGRLRYAGRSGILAITPPYFFTRPAVLSERLISETRAFDPYELGLSKRIYPEASRELGL